MKENTVRIELTTLIPFPSKGKLSDRQIDNRIARIEELKAQEKALKEAREAIEAEVQEAMGDEEHIQTEKYKVNWAKVTSNRFDTKSFKADHKRLYAKYTKEQNTRRFSFSTL